MPPKKYDTEKIVKEYVDGVTVYELHEKYGIPCNYVYELAKNAGITRNRSFRAVHEKILELHDMGTKHKEIAKIVNFKEDTVFNFLKEKRNLPRTFRKSPLIIAKDLILSMVREGQEISLIAQQFNVSMQCLKKYLKSWLGKEELKKIKTDRSLLKKELNEKKEYKPRVKKLKKDLNFEDKFSMKLAEKVYFMYFGGLSYEKIASYFHITIEQVSYCVDVWKNHLKKSNN